MGSVSETVVTRELVVAPPSRVIGVQNQALLTYFQGEGAGMPGRGWTMEGVRSLQELMEDISSHQFSRFGRRLDDEFSYFFAPQSHPNIAARGEVAERALHSLEMQCLSDLSAVLEASDYRLLSPAEWDAARSEQFLLTLPVTVDWSALDSDLIARFRAEHPSTPPAELGDKILIYHRGVDVATRSGQFLNLKVDALIALLLLKPLSDGTRALLSGLRLSDRLWALLEKVGLAQYLSGWAASTQYGRLDGAGAGSPDGERGQEEKVDEARVARTAPVEEFDEGDRIIGVGAPSSEQPPGQDASRSRPEPSWRETEAAAAPGAAAAPQTPPPPRKGCIRVERRTFTRVFESGAGVLKALTTPLHLQEACFQDLVVLYRPAARLVKELRADSEAMRVQEAGAVGARQHASGEAEKTEAKEGAEGWQSPALSGGRATPPAPEAPAIKMVSAAAVAEDPEPAKSSRSTSRSSAQAGAEESSDPLPPLASPQPLVLKHFTGVPMADVEMVFPAKHVFVPPVTILQIAIAVAAAFGAALSFLLQGAAHVQVLGSVLLLLGSRALQLYYSVEARRALIQREMQDLLYDRSDAAQEKVVAALVGELCQQRARKLFLCYSALLGSGKNLSERQIAQRCVEILEDQFDAAVDFACADVLAALHEWELVRRDDNGDYYAVELSSALNALSGVWSQLNRIEHGVLTSRFPVILPDLESSKGSSAPPIASELPEPASTRSGEARTPRSAAMFPMPDNEPMPLTPPGAFAQGATKSPTAHLNANNLRMRSTGSIHMEPSTPTLESRTQHQ